MKLGTGLAAVAAAVVVSGFAASAASANDLSGLRVEAVLGYDVVKIEGLSGNANGLAYGVGVGFDFPVGETMAFGVDAEIAESTTNLESEADRLETGRDIYVGGRLTGKVAERVALYAKAGYSNARVTLESGQGAGSTRESDNGDGFRAGAGAQFLLGGKAYIGAEYRYSNYEQDVIRHQAVATLGYRF